MKKSVLLYSVAVAAGAFLLKWLEYQHAVRVFSTEIYIVVIALLFAGLGVWAGIRIATPKRAAEFVKNEEAIAYMRISNREYEVLELLAQGCSNQEIAEKLFVSGNTGSRIWPGYTRNSTFPAAPRPSSARAPSVSSRKMPPRRVILAKSPVWVIGFRSMHE